MTDQRFAVRARELRRRRLKRIGLATIALIVIATLVWVIWFSTLLAVRGVEVKGQTTLKEAQILKAAAVSKGEPLARVDIAAIEGRIASIDRVRSVDVSRSWPRTISIVVVEREAVIWSAVGGKVRGIDREGVDFRSYSSAPKGLLEATITLSDRRMRLQTTRAVAAVVDLIGSKDPALRKQLQSVSARSFDSIELDLTKGRTVVWGSGADGERKLDVLDSLLKIKAARYDVSAPDQPTTRK